MNAAIFLIDLLQDVAVCRPIAEFFRREGGLDLGFVVTAAFRLRDATGSWSAELAEVARDVGADLFDVTTVLDAIRVLDGRSGMLLSSSESSLDAHTFTHLVFLAAPPSFFRVTVQHGLECVGFNHNEAHDRKWQHRIGMACDIAVSWFPLNMLHSLQPEQQAKIMTLGPPFGLDHVPVTSRPWHRHCPRTEIHGLVCENLHSVRFGSSAKTIFVDALTAFATELQSVEGTAELRPHPGGRYLEKNRVALPPNIRLNRLPLYKQALDKFAFGISAPSSVLLDMIWAGIPSAVWTSGEPDLDIGIYRGLQVVSKVSDWVEFAFAAARDPTPFLNAQAKFLAKLQIPTDVPERYLDLHSLALSAPKDF